MSYEEDKAKNEEIAQDEEIVQEATSQPVQEQQLSRSEQLMQQLYATREQAPVYDQAKEDRLKKMGKINMIGRGIGVLGDVLTMGLGGNVRRGQPDRVQPMLYQQYQAMLDKEKADQDNYRMRSYQTEKANIGMEISEERRKEGLKRDAENLKELRLQRQQDKDESNRRYDNSETNRKEAAVIAAKNHKDNLELGYKRLYKPTGSEDKETRPVTIKNNTGTVVLKPEEADWWKGKALQNPALLTKFPTWFTKVPEIDENGEATGNFITELDRRVTDKDLIREQMNIEADEKKVAPQISAVPPPYVIPGTTATQSAPQKAKKDYSKITF